MASYLIMRVPLEATGRVRVEQMEVSDTELVVEVVSQEWTMIMTQTKPFMLEGKALMV